jgi:PKD repeat protein
MRTNLRRYLPAHLLLAAMVVMNAATASGLEVRLPDSHPGIKAVKPGGALAKLDGALTKVYFEFMDHQRTAPAIPFRPHDRFLHIVKGRVLIDARAAGDAELLLSDLRHLGLDKGSRFADVVSGWLPVGAIRRAAELYSLRALSASIPMTNAGSVTSQGDVAQRSDLARTLYGVSGAGVKVGVLSDSYDQQNGAAADVASGDLPNNVQLLDDSAVCGDAIFQEPCTDEGRAMLQIVHDVAPGAGLAFHTAYNGFADFANGIVELANRGAQVIVDDVIYLGEPMFMDGVIAQAVDQVKGMGVAYFSAAGNAARASYEHAYDNSGEQFYLDYGIPGWPPVAVGPMHDFDSGPSTDTTQEHTIPAGQCAIFLVQWDSPFGSQSVGTGTQNDLDIWLVDESENYILAYDGHENIPTGDPVEAMQFCNDGTYVPTDPPVFKLIITLWEGAAPGLVKTVVFGNASIDAHATYSSTLFGHANAAGAEAVGAAYYPDTPEYGTNPPQLEYFSSAGGTPILFATNSTPLPAPEVRQKPEIVAPDGVDTTFFWPESDRNDNDVPDFSGTSAAAPHAAGVAALMLDKNSTATPDAVYAALESTAIDMMGLGFDYDSGFGLIQADQAVAAIATGNQPPTASFTFSCNGLTCGLDAAESTDDGTIVSYGWNYGDTNTDSGITASHTYASAGTYTVTLTVTDDAGASDSSTQTVTVSAPGANTPPTAFFTFSCNKLLCTFDASGSTDTDENGYIESYSWSYRLNNDAPIDMDSGATIAYPFSAAGTYTVTLTVTDNGGATADATAQVQAKNKGKSSGSSDAASGGDSGGGGGQSEICDNHIDDDGDGKVDCADKKDCRTDPACQ